jgi:hypothetical protein
MSPFIFNNLAFFKLAPMVISAKPLFWQNVFFSVSPHVLFSSDGESIWNDTDKLHKAKMNQCRNWWNPQWRDRIRAVMNYLAEGKDTIPLTLGSADDLVVNVNNFPLQFTSPISLIEEKKSTKAKTKEAEDSDDDLCNESDNDEGFSFEDDEDEDDY